MKKKTFLGFDITPRNLLWNRIWALEKIATYAIIERNMCDTDAQKLRSRIVDLENALQKFNRKRGKDGRFIN